MDPTFRLPASPGVPLFPISPERSNRQQPQQLPPSPSRSSISPTRERDSLLSSHIRGNSDVQGKVAQFNNLTKEAAQRRKDNEAALKRAVLGREEAESDARRLRDENDGLRREIEEGRGRERKVGERLESVMEEFQRTKETQANAHAVYEKEVRRARKEAFKSSSALVKLQEELKTARNRYTLMRVEADDQRRIASAKEEETLTAHNDIMQLREELETLKDQFRLSQEENEALKTAMKEEDVIRSAAEGAIALPPSREGDIGAFGSPRKNRKRDRESRKHYRENVEEEQVDHEFHFEEDELAQIKSELRLEKRMRLRADECVELLQIECEFGCCPCQESRAEGPTYVHSESYAKEIAVLGEGLISRGESIELNPGTSNSPGVPSEPEKNVHPSQEIHPIAVESKKRPYAEVESSKADTLEVAPATPKHPQHSRQISERLIDPSLKIIPTDDNLIDPVLSSPPPTNTAHPLNAIRPFSPPQQDSAPSPTLQNLDFTEIIPSLPFMQQPAPTPSPPASIVPAASTTTSTVPLKDEAFFSPAPATPGGISREEALEQIRARRGRARSYAAAHRGETPKRGILGTPRREISAPASRIAM